MFGRTAPALSKDLLGRACRSKRVLQVDKNDRIARLVLGVRAIKQKQYPLARRELAQSIRGPITDLVATLLSAWTMANPTEAKQATDPIDKVAGADWYAIFKELHAQPPQTAPPGRAMRPIFSRARSPLRPRISEARCRRPANAARTGHGPRLRARVPSENAPFQR